MISIEEQQNLLLAISNNLKGQIVAYAVGGTAMMFLGLKDATLDIDLVFKNERDKNDFIRAAKSLGYKEMDPIKVYGAKENHPDMLTLGNERFDLFVVNVIDFVFSENMQMRSEQAQQFGNNLILKIASYNDIILMKCATDRLKDKDDVRKILENKKIDWKIIVGEAKNQIKLGKEKAVFDLGFFLEDLKKTVKDKIPQQILDELFEFLKKQAEEKQKEK